MGFKKILVAIDRLSLALLIFEQALELAKKESASFMVFHCLDSANIRQLTSLIDVEEETKQIQEWLQTYHHKVKNQGVSAEFGYQVGKPGLSICDLAQNWEADLIVLGRRGYKGLDKVLLGSISNYVVHHASCSVLVIQG